MALLWMRFAIIALVSSWVVIATHGGSKASVHRCVPSDDGTYQCIKSKDQTLPPISAGVEQRIDGSEAEKAAIRLVLDEMNLYLREEVHVKPEYESIRSNCINMSDLCAFWTTVGECDSNRNFMMNTCAAACRFCLLANTRIV
mmetsp:Transcript_17160/g.25414  ORF Transcript_17160/g.25414 Transcript_17160/m.25414 type:complete len:143 (-) Transcript_17160:154-582(-)